MVRSVRIVARRHGVEAAAGEGLAAQEAPGGEVGPAQEAVGFEGFDRVLAAGRAEAAHARLERGDVAPVQADRGRGDRTEDAHGEARDSSCAAVRVPRPTAPAPWTRPRPARAWPGSARPPCARS